MTPPLRRVHRPRGRRLFPFQSLKKHTGHITETREHKQIRRQSTDWRIKRMSNRILFLTDWLPCKRGSESTPSPLHPHHLSPAPWTGKPRTAIHPALFNRCPGLQNTGMKPLLGEAARGSSCKLAVFTQRSRNSTLAVLASLTSSSPRAC